MPARCRAGRQVPRRRSHPLPDSRPRGLPAAATAWPGGRGRGHCGRRRGDEIQARRPRHRRHPSRGPGFDRDRARPRQSLPQSRHPRAIRRSAPTPNISCATKRCGCRCRTASISSRPASRSGRSRRRIGWCATGFKVRPGDNVLITGASGGMGQATLQLAKLAGARVIATTRHDGQGRDLARTRRRRRGRQRRRGRSHEGGAQAYPRRRRRSRRRLHRQSGIAALADRRDAPRRHARHHQRTGPRSPAVHRRRPDPARN